MNESQKQELIKALISGGYSPVDARNIAYGDSNIAKARYEEYCDKRCVLSDLFIGNFRLSQKFGVNKNVYKQFGLEGHDGIDYATPIGTPLLAPFDGIIISVKNSGKAGYGLHIKIWDKKRWCVLYGHMSKVSVKLFQTVKRGQLVGYTGNTGFSTGPHLHASLCETNILGIRLNTKNGFFGWLNMLDEKLVKWDIKNPTKPLP